nr:type-F conjugative transfer system protein TrbI [Enterobacter cloacae complex sp.]
MQQSAQLQLDEDKARVLTTRFNSALSDSLGEWQASHNAIILVKPAVMSDQRDITNEIRADIARRTQGASEKTTKADGDVADDARRSGAKDLGTGVTFLNQPSRTCWRSSRIA